MIRINLLPPEYILAQQKRQQQIIFGGAAGVVVSVLLLFLVVKKAKVSSLTEDIIKNQAQLATYQTIVSQIEQIERDKERMIQKRNVIKELNRSRLIYPVFFEDFLPIVPSDVWINNMTFSEAGGSISIKIQNNAASNFAIATWLTNLEQSPHFSGIILGPISYAHTDQGPSKLDFPLDCTYRHVGPFPLQEFN